MNEDQSANGTAVATDDQEWEQAHQDFAGESGIPEATDEDLAKVKPGKKDPEVEDEGADPKNKDDHTNETEEEKTAREAKEAEEAAAKPRVEDESARQVREQRGLQRELAADETAMKEDIRKEMFSDLQKELQDADGDPIRTIEDVQGMLNPNTGKRFTEEEAGSWLLQAQQHLNKTLQEAETKIEKIAETNITIKDQSDTIKNEFGELLKANPNGIRETIWDAYKDTLIKDEKTGIIMEAPVSLEKFYRAALAPYMKLAEQLELQAAADEKNGKKEADAQRNQTRSDRADITSGSKTDTRDTEEKEWDAAAKAHYSN